VEAVDRVGDAILGGVESFNFGLIAEVRLSGDDVSGSLGCFGLDDVGENEVDVGGLGVFQELASELV